MNAESTFARLSENLKTMLTQVTVKLQENDGRSNKIEELLLGLMNQNKIREKENQEMNNRIAMMCDNIEKQKHMFSTEKQAFKEELMRDVTRKVECGVPSETKKKLRMNHHLD